MGSDRPISIMGYIYSSLKEAARDLEAKPETIKVRLDSTAPEWEEWKYIHKSPEEFPKNNEIPCTYIHKHLPTGSFYIGSTISGFQRKHTHLWRLKNNINVCKKMQDLWNTDPNEENWEWTFVLQRSRELAYDAEQKLLTLNWGSPLLLNSVQDARSAITEVMAREEFRERTKVSLRTKTPEQLKAWGERSRQTALKRWSDPDKRAKFLGPNNPTAKKVQIDGVVYGSLKDAAFAHNVSAKTIWARMKDPVKYPNYTFEIAPSI